MPVAYSYVRFSTPDQAKGDSLRRQQALSEAYARENGLTLDTTLTFHDLGVSAFKGDNKERGRLGDFIQACDTGLVAPGSYLLVESLDRLSRSAEGAAMRLFFSILDRGIIIVTLGADRRVFTDKSDGMELMMSLTVMIRAHDESVTKSKRQRAAWNNKRANIGTKKLTAKCPLWMKLNESRTEFEFIPEHVELVKEMISLAKNGFGQAAIAKLFNERGTPAFSGREKGWWPSYVNKILTAKQLFGEFQSGITENGRTIANGEPIENYYPSIMTKDEYYSLQAFRSQNFVGGGRAKKGTTIPNLLSGKIFCGYCGGPMTISGAAAKRIKTEDGLVIRPPKKVLACDRARRGMGCYAVQWGFDDFTTAFLTFARGIDLDTLLADLRNDSAPAPMKLEDQVKAIDEEMVDIQKKIERLLDLVMEGNAPAAVNGRIARLETDKANGGSTKEKLLIEIQQRKNSGTDSVEIARATKSLIEKMEQVTDEERFKVRAALAAQLRRFIDCVKLYPVGRLVTPEFVEQVKKALKKQGFTKAQIDLHCSTYQTEPKRQGRGIRGKYASRADAPRYFTIYTKSGGNRVVYPDFNDPTKSKVTLSTGDQQENIPDEHQQLFDKVLEEFKDYLK